MVSTESTPRITALASTMVANTDSKKNAEQDKPVAMVKAMTLVHSCSQQTRYPLCATGESEHFSQTAISKNKDTYKQNKRKEKTSVGRVTTIEGQDRRSKDTDQIPRAGGPDNTDLGASGLIGMPHRNTEGGFPTCTCS